MPAPTASLNAAGVVSQEAAYFLSISPFTPPAAASADVAACIFVIGADTDSNTRSPSMQYDNSSPSPGFQTQAASAPGSFPWQAVFCDACVFDDTYIASRATSAFLGANNVSEDGSLIPVDLFDVVDGAPATEDQNSGTGTSSTVTAGGASFTHTWSGSQNFAHNAQAWNGTDGVSVIVVDCLIVWGSETITVDGGVDGTLATVSDTGADITYSAVVTFQVITSSGVTVALAAASEVVSAPALAVVPGELLVPLAEASEVVSAPALAAVPGELLVPLSAASEGVTASALTVVPGELLVPLAVVAESTTALDLAVVPGELLVPLAAAAEVTTALDPTVEVGVRVPLALAAEVATALGLAVVPGGITVALATASAVDEALALSVVGGGPLIGILRGASDPAPGLFVSPALDPDTVRTSNAAPTRFTGSPLSGITTSEAE